MALNTYAKIGDGAVVMLGSTSLTSLVTNEATSNYTTVAQVLGFNPTFSVQEHDVTHFQSSGARQYIPGHLDATVSMTLNLVPDIDSGIDFRALLDLQQAKTSRTWLLRIPQGQTNTSAATVSDLAFLGFVTNLNPNVDVNNPNTLEMTVRVADSTIVDQG